MRIFNKLSNKNDSTTKRDQETQEIVQPMYSRASVVPKNDLDDVIKDEHLLPSFQMHQFYINRSLVDIEDDQDTVPPPPIPPGPLQSSCSSDNADDMLSIRSLEGHRRLRRSSSSRRLRSSTMNRVTRSHSNNSNRSNDLTEEQMLYNLFNRNINYDSEKESILHNLNTLNHLQNKFIKMKIYIAKDFKTDGQYKQVTDDFSIREYQQGDEIKGFATISNNSKVSLRFEMFSTFLYGEVTVIRNIGDKFRHVFLKMIDLESSLLSEKSQMDCDGYVLGLPKNKILIPGMSYKIPFSFVLPDQLLDNVCECELTSHLRLPPSFGISKDSSGWFGNIPGRGYVCHNLSLLHSNTSHYGDNASQDSLEENSYMKGGDGIFTNDLCPNGVAISYGVQSVLIGASATPNELKFDIINDLKHQLRLVPHYLDNGEPNEFAKFMASRESYHSLESLRKRYELEINRLETFIANNTPSVEETRDENHSRKIRSVVKEKQLELAQLNNKLSNDIIDSWQGSKQRRHVDLKLKELKDAEKKYLNQKINVNDDSACSIVNFLSKSSTTAIQSEVNAVHKLNPTLFVLEKLNHRFTEIYSKSSYLKITCDPLDFNMNYKSPLGYKMEKNKTIWNLFMGEKQKKLIEQEKLQSSSTIQSVNSIADSINSAKPIYKTIDLDLEFVSIKSGTVNVEYQRPPKIKSAKVSLCILTVDSKHPVPINLRVDMFLNASNENVDLNSSENFMDSSRKMFSFAKHNNTGIVQEFRNYKTRFLKISKELDIINSGRNAQDEVNFNMNHIKALNSLLTLRYNKVILEDQDFEIKNFKMSNANWEISQLQIANESKLLFKNKLSITIDLENQNLKETLLPSFQSCLIARMYCFKIEIELEDGTDVGSTGYSKKKAVIYVPIEIK